MHQSALRQIIIFDRQVLRTAIVPHEQVADAPLVTIEELGAGHEVGQLLDEGECLRIGHADDADAFAGTHINGAASGDRVCANHRVDDVGQVLDRVRELAARGILFGPARCMARKPSNCCCLAAGSAS